MALSTISGPQTNFAPCLRAKRRVGTDIQAWMSGIRDNIQNVHTSPRSDHWSEEDTILEVFRCQVVNPGTFGSSGRLRRGRRMRAS